MYMTYYCPNCKEAMKIKSTMISVNTKRKCSICGYKVEQDEVFRQRQIERNMNATKQGNEGQVAPKSTAQVLIEGVMALLFLFMMMSCCISGLFVFNNKIEKDAEARRAIQNQQKQDPAEERRLNNPAKQANNNPNDKPAEERRLNVRARQADNNPNDKNRAPDPIKIQNDDAEKRNSRIRQEGVAEYRDEIAVLFDEMNRFETIYLKSLPDNEKGLSTPNYVHSKAGLLKVREAFRKARPNDDDDVKRVAKALEKLDKMLK